MSRTSAGRPAQKAIVASGPPIADQASARRKPSLPPIASLRMPTLSGPTPSATKLTIRNSTAEVVARIRTGTININSANFFGADAPFGGYKQSGVGREMGVEGFEEYLQIKTIGVEA